jgi:sec-independent protein translocase protein TatB
MFDIGFMELLLISIVALIVIGPERLPGAIRTATLWIGRAKRSFNQVKSDIEREFNADEIKRQLHNESILSDLKKAKTQADKLVENTRKNIDDINSEVNETLKQEEAQLKDAVADKAVEAEPKKSKAPEPAAAPVDDPASLDEVEQNDPDTSVDAEEADSTQKEPEKDEGPVTDFYNNPSTETVKVTGGSLRPTSSLDDETDSGRRS